MRIALVLTMALLLSVRDAAAVDAKLCLSEKIQVLLGLQIQPRPDLRMSVTSVEAQGLFDTIRDLPELPKAYNRDGCFARAHFISFWLEREHAVYTQKIFIQAGHGKSFRTRLPDGAQVDWKYHVAPVVDVETSAGQVVPMVIDTAFFNEPVPVKSWLAQLWPDAESPPRIEPSRSPAIYSNPGYFFTSRFLYDHQETYKDAFHESFGPPVGWQKLDQMKMDLKKLRWLDRK